MNENTFLFIINIFILVLCGVVFAIIPYLIRKSYLFGVKIPMEEWGCAQAANMRKNYIVTTLLGTFVAMAIAIGQYIMWPEFTIYAAIYLPLLIVIVYFIAFIPNWKRAVWLKADKGWKVSSVLFADTVSSDARGRLSNLPWFWYIIGFAIILVTVVISIMQYPSLPPEIPVHWGFDMQPTRFEETTMVSVLQLPGVNFLMLVIFVMTAIGIEKTKLQIDPSNPTLSFAQHRVYRKRMGHAFGVLTVLLILVIGVVGLRMVLPEMPFWNVIFVISMILSVSVAPLFIIVVQIKTGQGGCKVKIALDDSDESAEMTIAKPKIAGRGDDKFWKLGMFYYNPNDPGILIEDRFGTGVGFNYARLPVKIFSAILIIGLLAMYVWLTITIV
ncbi:MAG: DUF1648 domain-containing protein [Oscillospiraceae bacterium]|nr:DUF1648 domain-containing protein [Oscillospiraceae bacterium]